ncbi:hypothetical protein BTHE68_40930 [Burkholderia sp. THE68]|nr:hypothetical protein BTHE68_40930 [Burkholderia sp. THE68]
MSLFKGTLSANGVRAVDDHTVEFHLDGPNGAFPYYVSSDNVNGVVLPFDYAGPYEKSFIGTGPYKLSEFLPQVGASFVRNPGYWGQAPSIQRVEFKFYEDQQRQLIAIQGREVDLLTRFTVHGGLGVMNNPQFKIQGTRSSTHRQLHMRTSDGEFKDKRVRRALAMSLDRDAIVRGLLREKAVIGNDHPFAPFFSTFDSTVPQRGRDINGAKALLAQAGVPNGFSATLTTEAFLEMPDLAVVIQNAARSIGINLALRVEPQAAYYGAGTLGKSDWLDSPLGMTDYAHRGVPDAFLKGPLMANGPWNAARFANPRYDELVKVYLSTLDVSAKKQTAGQIERLLIDETPVIIPYFSDSLTLTRANVSGVRFTPMAQLYVDRAIVS